MRLTVGAKIFAGFLAVLLTFGAISGLAVFRIAQIGEQLRKNQAYLKLALEVNDLDKTQEELSRVVARNERTLYWRKARLRALADARKLAQQAGHSVFAQRLAAIEVGVRADEALGAEADAGATAARDRLGKRETVRSHDVRNLRIDVNELVEQVTREVEREGSRLLWGVLALVALATLTGAAVTFGAHATLRPLVRLTRHVEAVGRGEYGARLEVKTSDEIGELAAAFNRMAAALQEREQQLIRSERLAATGRIAAQITHEIRNPLSSIGLNTELLQDELAGTPEAERLLRAIQREVDRLTDITEQYLRFARLPQPKLEPEDLGAIARSLADFSREECARQKVELEVEIQPAPALADENQMRQALLNLIRNAREAMPGGGRLSVRVRLEDRAAVVRVGDTGPGIPAADRAHIFEPFFSTKEGGTGLGLALTQQIVTQHGGAIEIESEPGRGTTFVVRLPALDRARERGDDDGQVSAHALGGG
ncbi:MAG TPA: ATP-binding protein [Polyangia bacterium]|nr:ATP-binding protein [Polyangia bacterium]